jgi:hypothetical protein
MDNQADQNEVFSEAVRAGKRTYFFDVKQTKGGEHYLNITESLRKFDDETGKFYYEKHRIFLYQEDFEKFSEGLRAAIDYAKSSGDIEDQQDDNDPSETI